VQPARSPFLLGRSGAAVDRARHHEEQVRQAVDVHEDFRFNGFIAERNDGSFGVPSDGPRYMPRSTGGGSSCQDESAKRRQLGLQQIDPLLESADVVRSHGGFADAFGNFSGRIGESRAQSEEVALDTIQHLHHTLVVVDRRADKPQPRIQLVHIAVRSDARMVLRNARAIEQAGVAIIAGPGVDFHIFIISPDCSGQHTNRVASIPE